MPRIGYDHRKDMTDFIDKMKASLVSNYYLNTAVTIIYYNKYFAIFREKMI